MTRTQTLGRSTLATLLLALGCQGASTDNDPSSIDQALTQSYGAQTTEDEAPDFADDDFLAEDLATDEADPADSMYADSADMTGIESDPLVRPHHLRILVGWGRLRPQRGATDWTDWSGTISAANAGLRVLRTVRFEPGDSIVRPRTDLHAVAFVSHTAPAADGVLLDVVMHPRLNPAGAPVVLTFTSGPIVQELTLEPGMRRMDAVRVDDVGNALGYVIAPAPLAAGDACERGFLAGRYTRLGEVRGRAVGRIKGRWISSDGELRGRLSGLYGQRASGAKVFFAKVIGADGVFKGILAGKYGDGHFAGVYLGNRDRIVDGIVRGLYFEGRPDDGAGHFAGRWALRCGEAPAEGTPASADSDETDVALSE